MAEMARWRCHVSFEPHVLRPLDGCTDELIPAQHSSRS